MESFVNFYFWWLAVWMGIQAITICVRSYPHTSTKGVGQDVFGFIIMAVFFVWLLFIRLGVVS